MTSHNWSGARANAPPRPRASSVPVVARPNPVARPPRQRMVGRGLLQQGVGRHDPQRDRDQGAEPGDRRGSRRVDEQQDEQDPDQRAGGQQAQHHGAHHETGLRAHPIAGGEGLPALAGCARGLVVQQGAHVAEVGDRTPSGLGGGGARGDEVVDLGREIGADLLLEVLGGRRHLDPGEGLVQQAVDVGVHGVQSFTSRSVSITRRVATHAATLLRYTARPASVIR